MALIGYCKIPTWRKRMCDSCHSECDILGGYNKCELPTKDESCSDLSDQCSSIKHYCVSNHYRELMYKNCKSTCSFCNGIPPENTDQPETEKTPVEEKGETSDKEEKGESTDKKEKVTPPSKDKPVTPQDPSAKPVTKEDSGKSTLSPSGNK